MPIHANQQAPDFSLLDQHNQPHRLSDYRGRWVVLYFYPKDGTPGCTDEACSMRDTSVDFTDRQVVVLGISADTVQSHAEFAQQNNLNFTILADPDLQVIKTYDVLLADSDPAMAARTTFLINPEGEIAKVYQQVDPLTHPQQILADLQALD